MCLLFSCARLVTHSFEDAILAISESWAMLCQLTGEAYVLIREMAQHAIGVPRRFSWHVNENLQTVPKFTLCILCSNPLVSHLIGRFPAREDRSLISSWRAQ